MDQPSEPTPAPASPPLCHQEPDDPKALADYQARQDRKLLTARNARQRRTSPEAKARRIENLKKAHAARDELKKRRDAVHEKIKMGLPITEEERDLAARKFGHYKTEEQKNAIIDAAARLVIRPQSVTELRKVIENTAARYSYNPIEGLIKLAQSGELDPKEETAIHKSLLPYLCPALAPAREEDTNPPPAENGPKVVIKNFVVQNEKPAQAIHESKRENMLSRTEIVVESEPSQ